MVLLVMKYVIHPDKVEAYGKWVEGAMRTVLSAPGVIEFRAYRVATGNAQVVQTYEFADMAAWAAWNGNEGVQKVTNELYTLALNVESELWGPSPVVPVPIRPKAA